MKSLFFALLVASVSLPTLADDDRPLSQGIGQALISGDSPKQANEEDSPVSRYRAARDLIDGKQNAAPKRKASKWEFRAVAVAPIGALNDMFEKGWEPVMVVPGNNTGINTGVVIVKRPGDASSIGEKKRAQKGRSARKAQGGARDRKKSKVRRVVVSEETLEFVNDSLVHSPLKVDIQKNELRVVIEPNKATVLPDGLIETPQ